jgi:hypothetical protein
VFQKCSADLHNLKQTNYDEINVIPPVMLLRVVGSILKLVRHCIYLDGRHVVGAVFKCFYGIHPTVQITTFNIIMPV